MMQSEAAILQGSMILRCRRRCSCIVSGWTSGGGSDGAMKWSNCGGDGTSMSGSMIQQC